MSESLSYTATSSSEVLSFLTDGGPYGVPPALLLSDVSLSASAVPEPSSVVLLCTGLLGAIGVRWLRRRAGFASA